MTYAKYLPQSRPVDLTGWSFGLGVFDATAAPSIAETLERELKHPEAISTLLPVYWGPKSDGCGGDEPADPTTIYISLPFSDNEDGVYFQFSFADLVKEDLPEDKTQAGKLRDALLALAKLVNDMRFPNEAMPKLEHVHIPASLTQDLDLDECWEWQTNAGFFLQFVENEIANAQTIIDRVRLNKVRLEAARQNFIDSHK